MLSAAFSVRFFQHNVCHPYQSFPVICLLFCGSLCQTWWSLYLIQYHIAVSSHRALFSPPPCSSLYLLGGVKIKVDGLMGLWNLMMLFIVMVRRGEMFSSSGGGLTENN